MGEEGEGEGVVGVDGELGVDEEEDGVLDGVQAGDGPRLAGSRRRR